MFIKHSRQIARKWPRETTSFLIDHSTFWVRFGLSFLRDTFALQGKNPDGAFSKLIFDIKTQDSITQDLGHINLALLRCTLLTFN